MDLVKENFLARITEVEGFIKFARKLAAPTSNAKLGIVGNGDYLPMLKACTFLLIYNAVESCVRLAFSDVYDQIKKTNTTFSNITPALQKIWLTQQMDTRVSLTSSNRDTYLNAVETISSLICTNSTIELNARYLPVSGNLNADSIRDLCKKHGVILKVSSWAKGGVELETVKDKRNALAHGHISFVECGREYGFEDLDRILKQTKHYMNGLLKSVDAFMLKSAYSVNA